MTWHSLVGAPRIEGRRGLAMQRGKGLGGDGCGRMEERRSRGKRSPGITGRRREGRGGGGSTCPRGKDDGHLRPVWGLDDPTGSGGAAPSPSEPLPSGLRSASADKSSPRAPGQVISTGWPTRRTASPHRLILKDHSWGAPSDVGTIRQRIQHIVGNSALLNLPRGRHLLRVEVMGSACEMKRQTSLPLLLGRLPTPPPPSFPTPVPALFRLISSHV